MKNPDNAAEPQPLPCERSEAQPPREPCERNPPAPASASEPRPPLSRRIASSRANGAKSRGPITPEGKAASSHNAIRHGLAGNVLLPDENSETFQAFRDDLLAALKPLNPIATRIAESMVAARWRQNRIWDFESALLTDVSAQHPPSIQPELRYARAFRTLAEDQTLFLLDR